MADDLELTSIAQQKKRWLLVTIVCGVFLTLSVILGFGATVWKLQQSIGHIDDTGTSEEAFEQMVERSLLWSKIGLVAGALSFVGYIYGFIRHQRLKERLKRAREKERSLRIESVL